MEKHQDGIWIIDANSNTAYANQRMAEILGTTAEAMIGEPSFVYVFPEDASAAQQLFAVRPSVVRWPRIREHQPFCLFRICI